METCGGLWGAAVSGGAVYGGSTVVRINIKKRAAQQCNLPITVVTTPGRKLRDILTSSRPLDKQICPKNQINCATCNCLTEGECTIRNVVYKIECSLCGELYIGETYRQLHSRFQEHWYSACSPLKPSYKDKPLARHYSEHHPNIPPQLLLSVIARASNIKDRKVKEARMISTLKPSINIKDELKDTQLFLVQSK